MRKETRCCHMGYSFQLAARVLLYASSHRQDNTYHGLCYTSRGALAGTRNSSIIFINAYCSVGNIFMRKTWWITNKDRSQRLTVIQTSAHTTGPLVQVSVRLSQHCNIELLKQITINIEITTCISAKSVSYYNMLFQSGTISVCA